MELYADTNHTYRAEDSMNEKIKTIITNVLAEGTRSYRKFYEGLAQHLEKQGYDHVESDVRSMYKHDPGKAIEAVKEMIGSHNKFLTHPHLERAIKHHILGFDPHNAMN